MPDSSIDKEAKAVDKLKIEPVTDAYAEAMRGRPAGFSITENGETTFATPKNEFRALSDDEKKAVGKAPVEKKEPPKKEEAEPTGDDEGEEVTEEAFLKDKGLYNQFTKSIADVDKQSEMLRKQLMDNGEYLGNEELFADSDDPEEKIETLKSLRKVYGDFTNRKKYGGKAEEKTETTAPVKKTTYEMLSDEDRASLSDPTGENVAKVLDKMLELKITEVKKEFSRNLDQRDYRQYLRENPDFQETEINRIIKDKPYLKKALANLSLDETLDMLQTYRVSSQSKQGEAEAEKRGALKARQEELKRKGSLRLKPSTATREVASKDEENERALLAKIAEARNARKQGGNVRVANIVADAYAQNTRRPNRTKGFDNL